MDWLWGNYSTEYRQKYESIQRGEVRHFCLGCWKTTQWMISPATRLSCLSPKLRKDRFWIKIRWVIMTTCRSLNKLRGHLPSPTFYQPRYKNISNRVQCAADRLSNNRFQVESRELRQFSVLSETNDLTIRAGQLCVGAESIWTFVWSSFLLWKERKRTPLYKRLRFAASLYTSSWRCGTPI